MNNHKENDCHKRKKSKKDAKNSVTEEVVHDKLYIAKGSSNKYDSNTFIPDSGVTSHMITTEENISNLCNAEARVTIGDSITLTGTKRGD